MIHDLNANLSGKQVIDLLEANAEIHDPLSIRELPRSNAAILLLCTGKPQATAEVMLHCVVVIKLLEQPSPAKIVASFYVRTEAVCNDAVVPPSILMLERNRPIHNPSSSSPFLFQIG